MTMDQLARRAVANTAVYLALASHALAQLLGPAAGGWMIYMALWYGDEGARQAVVIPKGDEPPINFNATKTFGPFPTRDEAELGLGNAGWMMKVRFRQGGSQ